MPSFTVLDHPLAGDLLTRLRDERHRARPSTDRSRAGSGGSWWSRPRGTSPVAPRRRRDAARAVHRHRASRSGSSRSPSCAPASACWTPSSTCIPTRWWATWAWSATRRRTSRATTTRSSRRCRAAARWWSIRCSPPVGRAAPRCTYVKEAGATDISFVCVVAAPEGLARMQADHPDVPIVAARAGPAAQRPRVHRARPRRLRRPPVRHAVATAIADSLQRAAALVGAARRRRRPHLPHEPGDRHDRHDVRASCG